MIVVSRYSPSRSQEWDRFIAGSKNGTFLFYRSYMDYHAVRFEDHSLMVLDGDRLAAVLPANVSGDCLCSHGGLTFGGLVTDTRMTAARMLAVFNAMCASLRALGIAKLIYKPVPHIFHTYPAEEDLYALFRAGAVLTQRDLASALRLETPLRWSKGRTYAVKQAEKAELRVEETSDVATFMGIVSELLQERHNASPTHSAGELEHLMGTFPDRIKLYGAYRKRDMLAGAVVYDYGAVAHTQYLANSAAGRNCGALDLVVQALVEKFYAGKQLLSFGTSTEDQGRKLNEGLVAQKEMFGARAIAFDRYELRL